MKKELLYLGLTILLLAVGIGGAYALSKWNVNTASSVDSHTLEVTPEPTAAMKNTSPKMVLKEDVAYEAVLHTTDGDITISLDTKNTPITANNFVALARKKFYNNTIFHRVIKDFMIQGGDPKGNGSGDAGYSFDDEPIIGEYTKGTVAMANRGPNTNGSQFFIMHKDTALPKNYVIFGKVVAGLDVLDTIASQKVVVSAAGELSQPVEPVKITSIDIIEQP